MRSYLPQIVNDYLKLIAIVALCSLPGLTVYGCGSILIHLFGEKDIPTEVKTKKPLSPEEQEAAVRAILREIDASAKKWEEDWLREATDPEERKRRKEILDLVRDAQ